MYLSGMIFKILTCEGGSGVGDLSVVASPPDADKFLVCSLVGVDLVFNDL